jgi:hypothetical protein
MTFRAALDDNEFRELAATALNLALGDEVAKTGAAMMTATLCCFVECRILEALKAQREVEIGAALRLPDSMYRQARLN